MPVNQVIEPVDLIPSIDEDEGWSHKGCAWSDSPCGETPEYFISYPCPEHGRAHAGETLLFCPRHYALSLLHILEVAVPLDGVPFNHAVYDHGPLEA